MKAIGTILAVVMASPSVAQPQNSLTEQWLSKAITLYATDSPTNEAEMLFRRVISQRAIATPEGDTARYYLGRFYHRNFYMLGQPALDSAAREFRDLHNATGDVGRKSRWYAEARFYKGLVYIEQGKWKDTCESLNNLVVDQDETVEIDYLIWSASKRPLDLRLPTTFVKKVFLDTLGRVTGPLNTRCDLSGRWQKDHSDPRAARAITDSLQASFEGAKLRRTRN